MASEQEVLDKIKEQLKIKYGKGGLRNNQAILNYSTYAKKHFKYSKKAGGLVDTNRGNIKVDKAHRESLKKDIETDRRALQQTFTARNRKLLLGTSNPLKSLRALSQNMKTEQLKIDAGKKGFQPLLKRLQRNLSTDALEGGKEFDVRSEDKIAESKTKAGYLDNQAKYQPGPIASELMQYSDLKETEDQIITDSIRERAKALKKSKPVPGSEEAVQFNNDVNDLGKKINKQQGNPNASNEENLQVGLARIEQTEKSGSKLSYKEVLGMKRGRKRDELTLNHWTEQGYNFDGLSKQDKRDLANELRIRDKEFTGTKGTFIHYGQHRFEKQKKDDLKINNTMPDSVENIA